MAVSLASVVFGSNCHRRRRRRLLPLLLLLLVGLAYCSRAATDGVEESGGAKGEEFLVVEGDGVKAMGVLSSGDFDAAGCTVLQHTTTYK